MKVTLSAAMRARDVSRPRPDEETTRVASAPRRGGSNSARPGPADGDERAGDAKDTTAGRRRRRR